MPRGSASGIDGKPVFTRERDSGNRRFIIDDGQLQPNHEWIKDFKVLWDTTHQTRVYQVLQLLDHLHPHYQRPSNPIGIEELLEKMYLAGFKAGQQNPTLEV